MEEQFKKAVIEGDIEQLKALLNEYPNAFSSSQFSRETFGSILIDCAEEHEQFKVMDWLFEHGVSPFIFNIIKMSELTCNDKTLKSIYDAERKIIADAERTLTEKKYKVLKQLHDEVLIHPAEFHLRLKNMLNKTNKSTLKELVGEEHFNETLTNIVKLCEFVEMFNEEDLPIKDFTESLNKKVVHFFGIKTLFHLALQCK